MTLNTPRPAEPSAGAHIRELRLALVCYGGVSLAIYMHGVTKELHKLVRASAAAGSADFPEKTSERAYGDLLRRLEATTGVRTRVVVDIIAGTSAGGINGICLAKALALNESQDALKDLWFDKGDINKLAAGASWIPAWLKTPELVVRSLVGAGINAPLRGDEMCRWLHEAFQNMDDAPRGAGDPVTLMPADHLLELYVTVTDLHGYTRELPISDPRVIKDLTHRHVLVFRYASDADNGFTRDHNHALAFAARATSSFPGAFPPLRFVDYSKTFAPAADLALMERDQFALYRVNGIHPSDSAFVDGGVLDNAPFDHVVRAIRQRPAATQVDRRLLYIEPDPVGDEPSATREPTRDDSPRWVKTILSSLSSVPAGQPILDDLNALVERNRLVRRIRDVIETNFDAVRKEVERLAAKHDLSLATLSAATPQMRVVALRNDVAAAAEAAAGMTYASYIRLRLGLVLDDYAASIAQAMGFPADSYPARFIETVVRDWAKGAGLQDNTAEAVQRQTAFLRAADLTYHERRLRFLIAAFSWWYGALKAGSRPTRAELDDAKATLYRRITDLADVITTVGESPQGKDALAQAFPDVKEAAREQRVVEYVQHHRRHFDELRTLVEGAVTRHAAALENALYTDLVRLSDGWPADMRTDLFARYFGFPSWDVIVYPIQALADIGERDHVEVIRISPLDTKHLEGGTDKLKGIGFHHFAAFFKRSYRENDYLWGRLDAAERLAGLLLDDPRTPGLDAPAHECRPLFEAILQEERDSLATVGELVETVRRRIAALPARA